MVHAFRTPCNQNALIRKQPFVTFLAGIPVNTPVVAKSNQK